jgi:hypothetical protein
VKGYNITRSGLLISHWTDEGGSPAKGGTTTTVCHGHGGGSPKRGENSILVGLFQCALLLHGRREMGNSLRGSPSGGEVWATVLDSGVVASCFGMGMSELQGSAGVAKGPNGCGSFRRQPGWQQFSVGSPPVAWRRVMAAPRVWDSIL